jgi:hypothetical protein
MKFGLKYLALLVLICPGTISGQGQFFRKLLSSGTDTNYIIDYSKELTTRIYVTQKSASFRLYDGELKKSLDYLPNEKLVLGIGANHGFLGINLGISFPFVNNDDDKYGTTKYLNFSTRLITRKLYFDLLLQYYKGYYLSKSSVMIRDWPDDKTYMIRGDLRTYSVGLSAHYIFNNKKFSYRASFLQNEWQKKSAGSFLLGAEIYYHVMKGDSSMVPLNLKYNGFYYNQHFSQVDIFTIGPTVGYGYTFVVRKHWFLSLSLTLNLALGSSSLHPDDAYAESTKSGLTVNFITVPRFAFGYNSSKWCFDISYNNLSQQNQSPYDSDWIQFDTGNFRINIVRRFHMKKPVKILNPEF